jgi:hypothetical protein
MFPKNSIPVTRENGKVINGEKVVSVDFPLN